mmetsp:Transcript_32256/g.78450  ORF Transcript_32256/g.78450 Transcript_32256/m.78450 type:complete len:255 (+) Transcript_32256:1224-1988(+)
MMQSIRFTVSSIFRVVRGEWAHSQNQAWSSQLSILFGSYNDSVASSTADWAVSSLDHNGKALNVIDQSGSSLFQQLIMHWISTQRTAFIGPNHNAISSVGWLEVVDFTHFNHKAAFGTVHTVDYKGHGLIQILQPDIFDHILDLRLDFVHSIGSFYCRISIVVRSLSADLLLQEQQIFFYASCIVVILVSNSFSKVRLENLFFHFQFFQSWELWSHLLNLFYYLIQIQSTKIISFLDGGSPLPCHFLESLFQGP